jgi:hypothetical protein
VVTVSAEVSYPLEVEGRLDPQLSRWLWLVKWLLAIPHFVVLAFLWVAFFVLTFVALVAIVFTGRYPRSLFEFNVGVLRWTWRVGFYTFAALGTDHYPPFTLGSAPDYPARLDVVYPVRLSRGLALVKWWLLAIPQYVIVAFLLGGGMRWNWVTSGVGLIDVLVLFAGVALLFTGRYPQGIFDLVVGLDRWALRVAAYAALMTDRYPPFRLDMGGPEPAARLATPEAAPAEAAPVAGARRWTFGRVVLVVLGSLAALLAFGLATSGAAALVVDHTQRDGDGYLMSPSKHLATGSYALVSQPTNLGSDVTGRDFLGTVRIRTDSDSDRRVFVGIARSAAAAAYLDGMRHAEVSEISPWHVGYDMQIGGPPSTPPASQTFWAASATGSGKQVLDWKPAGGTWRVVVMNADGSPRVAVDASIGAQLDNWFWVGAGLLAAGLLLAFAAAGLIHLGIKRTEEPAQP